jgi:hypothetical protein
MHRGELSGVSAEENVHAGERFVGFGWKYFPKLSVQSREQWNAQEGVLVDNDESDVRKRCLQEVQPSTCQVFFQE